MTRAEQLGRVWPGLGVVAVAIGLVMVMSGSNATLALSRLAVEGAVVLLWAASAGGVGGAILRGLRWFNLASSPARPGDQIFSVALAVGLGWGVFSVVTLGLGLAGGIGGAVGPWLAWAMLVPGWVWGTLFVRQRVVAQRHVDPDLDETAASDPSEAGSLGVLWIAMALGGALLGMALFLALLPPGLLWPGEPNRYDVVAYHFQIPREWYEMGRIVPLQHNVFSYMPLGMEMHYLTAMGLMGVGGSGGGSWGSGGQFSGAYPAQLMHVAFFAVAAVGVYGMLRPWGQLAAVVGTLGVAGCPYMLLLAPIGYNEGALVLYGVLMCGVLMRDLTFRDTVRVRVGVSGVVVLGLLGGFAVGAKLTAGPMLVVPVAVALWAATRFSWRGLAGGVMVGVLAMVVASPWLVRTAAWTSGGGSGSASGAMNPVFPLLARQLGQAHFTDAQVTRFETAHAPRPEQASLSGRAKALWVQTLAAREFGYALIPAAVLALGSLTVSMLRSRRAAVAPAGDVPTDDPHATPDEHAPAPVPAGGEILALCFGGVVVLQTGVWMFATHLQGRFFVPAMVSCALILGLWAGRRGWGGGVALLVVTVVGAGSLGLAWERLGFLKDDEGAFQTQIVGVDYIRFVRATMREETSTLGPNDKLRLVGDSRAYLYPMPQANLKYRSVFDVPVGENGDSRQAWGVTTSSGEWLWVDPRELRRFNTTYKTPPAPEDWDRSRAFMLRPE